MSKDRKWIAKGTPRNRELVPLDKKSKQRSLTYSSTKRAENALTRDGFGNEHRMVESMGEKADNHWAVAKLRRHYLEAVKARMIIEV